MEVWKIFVSLKNARWSDSSMFKYHFKSFKYILIIVIVCELQLFWPKIMQRDFWRQSVSGARHEKWTKNSAQ